MNANEEICNDCIEITVLKTISTNHCAHKTFKGDGAGGIVKISDYKAGKKFTHFKINTVGIKGLGAAIAKLSAQPQCFPVRAEVRSWIKPDQVINRLGSKNHGDAGDLQASEQGQRWVMLDLDKMLCPESIDFLGCPVAAVEYAITQLPAFFQNVTVFYQLSNSAGVDGGEIIKVHLFYELTKPIRDEVLYAWCKTVKTVIDPATFISNQPHYIASPKFEGCDDPFKDKRMGFVYGETDKVNFPDFVPLKNEVLHGVAVSNVAKTHTASLSFSQKLAAIGDHPSGEGCYGAIWSALSTYTFPFDDFSEIDDKYVIDTIQKTVKNAVWISHSPEYVNSKSNTKELKKKIREAWASGMQFKKEQSPFKKINGIAPHFGKSEYLTLSDAHEMLKHIIKKCVYDGDCIVLNASLGLGKSSQMVNEIVIQSLVSENMKVWIYVPTIKLAKELEHKLSYLPNAKKANWQPKGMPSGLDVVVIHGRHAEVEDSEFEVDSFGTKECDYYCDHHKAAAEVANKGYPVYSMLCQRGKGSNYERCDSYDTCRYNQQFRKPYDVRILTHAYLKMPFLFNEKNERPDIVIIDESPILQMRVTSVIPLSKVSESSICTELKKLLINSSEGVPLLQYLRKSHSNDDLQSMISSSIEASIEISPSIITVKNKSKFVEELPFKYDFKPVLESLSIELMLDRDNCNCLDRKNDSFTFSYRPEIERIVNDGKQIPTLILDGSADKLLYDYFLEGFDYYDVQVKGDFHHIQINSTSNSKSTLKLNEHKKLETENILEWACSKYGAENVFVTGPQELVGNAKEKIEPLLKMNEKCSRGHNNSLRGVNDFEDHLVSIDVSRNQPNVKDLEAIAKGLFFDDKVPLKITGELILMARGYETTTGYLVGSNIPCHADNRIQHLLEQIREHESVQNMCRVRTIGKSAKKLYISLSKIVKPYLPVDNSISWRDAVNDGVNCCSNRLTEMWNSLDGVLPLAPKWLHSKFPKMFKNVSSVSDYLTTIGVKESGADAAEILNSLIVFNNSAMFVYRYRKVGAKGKSSGCVSKYGLVETKERLESMLGCAVIVS